MTTWRSIETAPKDGTCILVAFPPHVGGQQIVTWFEKKSGYQWVDAYTLKKIYNSPTHWMPLPPDPIISTGNPHDRSTWRCSCCGASE